MKKNFKNKKYIFFEEKIIILNKLKSDEKITLLRI